LLDSLLQEKDPAPRKKNSCEIEYCVALKPNGKI